MISRKDLAALHTWWGSHADCDEMDALLRALAHIEATDKAVRDVVEEQDVMDAGCECDLCLTIYDLRARLLPTTDTDVRETTDEHQ